MVGDRDDGNENKPKVDSPEASLSTISSSDATVARIREAVGRPNLDYWTRDDSEKPNLPRSAFEAVVPLMPFQLTFKREERKSKNGKHGHDGDDYVFMTEFEVKYGRDLTKKYYLKGYFFPKGETKGLTVQSFRFA